MFADGGALGSRQAYKTTLLFSTLVIQTCFIKAVCTCINAAKQQMLQPVAGPTSKPFKKSQASPKIVHSYD